MAEGVACNRTAELTLLCEHKCIFRHGPPPNVGEEILYTRCGTFRKVIARVWKK